MTDQLQRIGYSSQQHLSDASRRCSKTRGDVAVNIARDFRWRSRIEGVMLGYEVGEHGSVGRALHIQMINKSKWHYQGRG